MRVRVRVRRCLEEERVSSLQLVHVGDEDGSAPAAAAAAAALLAATATTTIAAAVNSIQHKEGKKQGRTNERAIAALQATLTCIQRQRSAARGPAENNLVVQGPDPGPDPCPAPRSAS